MHINTAATLGRVLAIGALALGATGARAEKGAETLAPIQLAQAAPARDNAAQEAQGPRLETIVVTARKIEENLLQVPIAISAFTADDIERTNLKDFNDLQRSTPGFTFTEGGGNHGTSRQGGGLFTVRGLNTGNAKTQLFVDGAPLTNGRLSTFMDAERVEILKGPQTAYFGRNTFAGAVNIVTKTPKDIWAARVAVEFASYGSHTEDVSVEGPVIPGKLAVRVSGIEIEKGGMYKDVAKGSRLGERNTKEATLNLYATPNDRLNVKLVADYSVLDDGPPAAYNMAPIQDGLLPSLSNCNPRGAAALTWFCGELPWANIGIARSGMPSVYDALFVSSVVNPYRLLDHDLIDHIGYGQRAFYLTLNANYDFNGITWNTIAAYHRNEYEGIYDYAGDASFMPCVGARLAAGCGRPFGQNLFIDEGRPAFDYSVETRLTSAQGQRLRWTGGVNYVRQISGPTGNSGEEPHAVPHIALNGNKTEARTYALFGGLYFDVLPNFTLSGEARYQWDWRRNIPTKPVNLLRAGDQLSDSTFLNFAGVLYGTFKNFAPRVTAEYHITPDVMLFANFARGFTPGNFNSSLYSNPPEVVAVLRAAGAIELVKSEQLDQYEIGIKGMFMDGRFENTLVGYFGKISNQQITTQTAQVVLGFTVFNPSFLSNAGRTDLHGVEWEGRFAVTKELTVNGFAGWNGSEIVIDLCGICNTLAGSLTADIGKRLPNAPEYSAGVGFRYTTHLNSRYDWFISSDYSYRGSMFATRLNLERSGVSNLVSLRVGVQDEKMQVEAYITNLLQDKGIPTFAQSTRYVIPPPGAPANFNFYPQSLGWGLPDRRQFGVRANYKF